MSQVPVTIDSDIMIEGKSDSDEVTMNVDMMMETSTVEEVNGIVESNSPEITVEDIHEIAKSLMSSLSSMITVVDCVDAETSTVPTDVTTTATAITPTPSPVRKTVSSQIRAEMKDAETETEDEYNIGNIQVPVPPVATTTVSYTLPIPAPNYQSGNEENVSPWNSRAAEMFRVSEINGHQGGDRTLPRNHGDLDILRLARKRASQDRLVPQGKKYIKTKPDFRKQNENRNLSTSAGTSIIPSRRPLSIRLYDLDYLGEPPILEDESLGDDDENASTVPDTNPQPSNPHLRLGLSRRSHPRRPLHENFMNENE